MTLGQKPSRGPFGDRAGEHDLDLVGATEVELVADRLLKPAARGGGRIEHTRVGHLDLAHREPVRMPPALRRCERRGQHAHPAIKELEHVRVR